MSVKKDQDILNVLTAAVISAPVAVMRIVCRPKPPVRFWRFEMPAKKDDFKFTNS